MSESSTDTTKDSKSSSSSSSTSSSDSSSSSSSSSSDNQSKFPREYEKYLSSKEKKLTATEIFYTKRSAVVALQTLTTFILPGSTNPQQTAIGTGFFIGNNYIVTSAQLVLYTQFIGPRTPAPPDPPGPSIVRVNKIFAHVVDVNGEKNNNLVYEADLIGIDGAANVALLHISDIANPGLPKLRNTNHFRFGRSRDYAVGRPAFTIANDVGDDTQSIRSGIVTNNRQFSKIQGSPPVELIVVDFPAYIGTNVGAPIIDEFGDIIGILNQNFGSFSNTPVGGTSEYFMEPILKALRAGGNNLVKGEKLGEFAKHLQLVVDPVGNYYLYVKGFLGIAWTIYSPISYVNEVPGYKKTQGIVVTALVATTPLGQLFTPLFDSGATILITDIDGCPIGNIPNQITPADITWRKIPGDKVKITYRVSTDGFAGCQAANVALAMYPYDLDLPDTFFMAPNPVKTPAVVPVKDEVDSKHSTTSDVKNDTKSDVKVDVKSEVIEKVKSENKPEVKGTLANLKRNKAPKGINRVCINCKLSKANCDKCVVRESVA
ncbi:MAG: PDZ domain-containing protein [Solumvirus sp.]|uniref:PDZ domain-containing protein n=1 Tax=Solumvirus sp. TaxID=2487773 RepID=A0A3G5AGT7_9VIRU|nr:MAG: PDZ domain-containing protein [Solumvirus sp.]